MEALVVTSLHSPRFANAGWVSRVVRVRNAQQSWPTVDDVFPVDVEIRR